MSDPFRYAKERSLRTISILSRTFETDLTDDELTLIDVMFDGGAYLHLLRRDVFPAVWNRPSHNLSDVQLGKSLGELVNRGILASGQDQHGKYFELTSAGGHVWEREREPEWDRFAAEQYGQTKSGRPVLKIVATTQQCRDDFWQIGCEIGCFAYSDGRTRKAVIRNHALIPWKSFRSIYVLLAVLDGWTSLRDRVAFENRRTWWRSPKENEKFRIKSA